MKRQLSLDVLRGIAVLLVIFHHLQSDNAVFQFLRNGGWVGVDLFFVLSGFLVSGLLFKQHQKEGRIRPVNFLIRRGFKIYPAFWVFLAVSAAFFALLHVDHYWSKLWHEGLFIQNYTYESDGRFWRHTWSLAVEEHFYLLLPAILFGLQHDRFRALPRIVLAVCTAVFICKCIKFFQPFEYSTHYTPTHLRIDGLFFGTLLSYWHHYWPAFNDYCRSRSRWLLAAGITTLIPAFVQDIYQNPLCTSVWMTAQYIGSGMILMSVVTTGIQENRVTSVLGFIGRYSYSIYLWHVLVTDVALPLLGLQTTAGVWIGQIASVGFGVVMSELIETPMLKLRELMTASRSVAVQGCQS